jgi:subtilisin family serine protease
VLNLFNTERINVFSEEDILNHSIRSFYKKLLNVDRLYQNDIFGNDLVCAVLDTGCNKDHPALSGKIKG